MQQKSIAGVFKDYRESLLSFVRSRINVKDEAEDIVQEIFYQLSRTNDLARPIENTTAWLFRVARNMIINWRKRKKDISFSDLVNVNENDSDGIIDILDILLSDKTTPETEIIRSFLWKEIETVLEELPSSQREIFIQTEYLCIPVKEISKKTNVPVNTLLSRKHYAVLYLRKRLKNLYMEISGRRLSGGSFDSRII